MSFRFGMGTPSATGCLSLDPWTGSPRCLLQVSELCLTVVELRRRAVDRAEAEQLTSLWWW